MRRLLVCLALALSAPLLPACARGVPADSAEGRARGLEHALELSEGVAAWALASGTITRDEFDAASEALELADDVLGDDESACRGHLSRGLAVLRKALTAARARGLEVPAWVDQMLGGAEVLAAVSGR